MAPRGYCTTADVEAELGGVTLPPAEATAVTARIAATEDWLDGVLGRQWLIPSPATEAAPVYGQRLYLAQRPVLALTSVTAQSVWPGAPPVLLGADADYTLLDAARGLVLVRVRDGTWVTVSYTHTNTATVPAAITLATTKLVAEWHRQTAAGAPGEDVKRYSVGQELTVERFDPAGGPGLPLPPTVQTLLAPYRGRGLLA